MLKQQVKIRKTLLQKTVKCQQQCRCIISKWINYYELLTRAILNLNKKNIQNLFLYFGMELKDHIRKYTLKQAHLCVVCIQYQTAHQPVRECQDPFGYHLSQWSPAVGHMLKTTNQFLHKKISVNVCGVNELTSKSTQKQPLQTTNKAKANSRMWLQKSKNN